MGMEGGRYGTFCVEDLGFLFGFPSIWADFLRFVYRGVDCPPPAGARTPLKFQA